MSTLITLSVLALQAASPLSAPSQSADRARIESDILAATAAREGGRLDDAFAAADRAIAAARVLTPADPVLLSDALVVRCDAAAGRSEPDISDCHAALALREANLPADDVKLHNLRIQIAVHSVMAGKPAEAQPVIETAIAGLRRAPQTPAARTDVGMGVAVLGMALQAQDRRQEAEASYRAAIAELAQADETGRGYRPVVYNYLNGLLLNEGRLVEALEDTEVAVGLQRATAQPGDPTLIGALGALGAAQQRAGRYADAEATLREQLGLLDAQQSPQPSLRGNALTALAALYTDTGRIDLARPLLEQAVDVYHQGGDAGRRSGTTALGRLADLDLVEGDAAGAVARIHGALADLGTDVAGSQGRAALLTQLATAQSAAGEDAAAETAAQEAVDIYRQIAPKAPAQAPGLVVLARAALSRGETELASSLLDQAVDLSKARPPTAPTRLAAENARVDLALQDGAGPSENVSALAREAGWGAQALLVGSARSGQTVGGVRDVAKTALLNHIESEWRASTGPGIAARP